jgi:ELWxxDGT repeat protein
MLKKTFTFIVLVISAQLFAQKATLLKNINANSSSFDSDSDIATFNGNNYFTQLKSGKIIFLATDGSSNCKLYETDGTTTGTKAIASLTEFSKPSVLTSAFDANTESLLFNLNNFSNSYISKIWLTTGNNLSVKEIKDFQSAVGLGTTGFYNVNGKILYKATAYYNGQYFIPPSIYAIDSFFMKTYPLKLFKDAQDTTYIKEPNNLIAYDDKLYFTVGNSPFNQEKNVWETDGTVLGTKVAFSMTTAPKYIYTYKGINGLYIETDDGKGKTTWTYYNRNTKTATKLITNTINKHIHHMISMGGKDYFLVKTYASNDVYELFVSDGTETGTQKVTTLPYFDDKSATMYAADDYFVFNAAKGVSPIDPELYISKGTEQSTFVVDIYKPTFVGLNSGGSNPKSFIKIKNKIYFNAYCSDSLDNPLGYELVETDGTASGTHIVKDFNKGIGGFDPIKMTHVTLDKKDYLMLYGNIDKGYEPYLVSLEKESGIDVNDNVNPINTLSIAPNPARDIVNISLKDTKIIQVQLIDLTGKVILDQKNYANNSSLELNCSNIANGVYLVKVLNEDGNLIVSKMVKN